MIVLFLRIDIELFEGNLKLLQTLNKQEWNDNLDYTYQLYEIFIINIRTCNKNLQFYVENREFALELFNSVKKLFEKFSVDENSLNNENLFLIPFFFISKIFYLLTSNSNLNFLRNCTTFSNDIFKFFNEKIVFNENLLAEIFHGNDLSVEVFEFLSFNRYDIYEIWLDIIKNLSNGKIDYFDHDLITKMKAVTEEIKKKENLRIGQLTLYCKLYLLPFKLLPHEVSTQKDIINYCFNVLRFYLKSSSEVKTSLYNFVSVIVEFLNEISNEQEYIHFLFEGRSEFMTFLLYFDDHEILIIDILKQLISSKMVGKLPESDEFFQKIFNFNISKLKSNSQISFKNVVSGTHEIFIKKQIVKFIKIKNTTEQGQMEYSPEKLYDDIFDKLNVFSLWSCNDWEIAFYKFSSYHSRLFHKFAECNYSSSFFCNEYVAKYLETFFCNYISIFLQHHSNSNYHCCVSKFLYFISFIFHEFDFIAKYFLFCNFIDIFIDHIFTSDFFSFLNEPESSSVLKENPTYFYELSIFNRFLGFFLIW